MAIKSRYKTEAEVPAELKTSYIKKQVIENGTPVDMWVLDVDGDMVPRDRFEEFRANNIDLKKQLDTLTEQFKGIEPAKVRELLKTQEDLEADKLVKAGKVDELVTHRTTRMKADYEAQIKAANDQITKQAQQLSEIQINQGVLLAGTKRGVRATATLDLINRARSVFTLNQDGKVIALDRDGKSVIYGQDGITPLSVEEWVTRQVTEAPHLFEANQGSGASGNGSGGAGSVTKNPFAKETWNLTEQCIITRKDPALATRLAAAVSGGK